MRTKIHMQSGVLPFPVFTKPSPCGGNCLFCPQDGDLPRSYTYNEDTAFAAACGFLPALQVERFVGPLLDNGLCGRFPCEVVVLGGSFSAQGQVYRREFLQSLYDYMAEPSQAHASRLQLLPSIVTVESRPDQISWEECRFLRATGVSKVEIGVQHTSDHVLEVNKRGHGQREILRATQLLKEMGFKVGYHVILGLPGASVDDDLKMLTDDLWRVEYSPDYLKVYPCVLLKNQRLQPQLHSMFRNKQWSPMNEATSMELLRALGRSIPPFVRVSRIQRQFSSREAINGLKPGLRMRLGASLRDIRYREAGRVDNVPDLEKLSPLEVRLIRRDRDMYIEVLGTSGVLLGIARIRRCTDGSFLIREIRVYGETTATGTTGPVQGRGLGSMMLKKVEDAASRSNAGIVRVNASPGARSFFIRHGYSLEESLLLSKVLPNPRRDNGNETARAFVR